MNEAPGLLTEAVREAARRSVLCWLATVGQRFTIRSVLVIQVQSVAAIVAPSYRFYPDDTTEASQVASAMRAYGVKPSLG